MPRRARAEDDGAPKHPPVTYDHILTAREVFRFPELGLEIRRVREQPTVHQHGHDFQEIVYVVRGTAMHEVELLDRDGGKLPSRRYPLLPGDCFILVPGERHAFLEPRDIEICNILFTPALFELEPKLLQEVPGLAEMLSLAEHGAAGTKMHLDLDERSRVLSLFEAIESEAGRQAAGFKVAMRAHFLALLVNLARAWQRARGKGTASDESGKQRHSVEAALAFMEENYHAQLTLQQIADKAGLSANHFSEVFKQHCGISPWEFLTTLRLDRAKHLLRTTSDTITGIALAVGFEDSSYFARLFKAQVGMTPRACRAAR
jgi:AraC-like DNA-binding protein